MDTIKFMIIPAFLEAVSFVNRVYVNHNQTVNLVVSLLVMAGYAIIIPVLIMHLQAKEKAYEILHRKKVAR